MVIHQTDHVYQLFVTGPQISFFGVLRVISAVVAVVQDLLGCMIMLTTGPSSPPFLPQWSMGRQMLPSSPCPSSQGMQVCLSFV